MKLLIKKTHPLIVNTMGMYNSLKQYFVFNVEDQSPTFTSCVFTQNVSFFLKVCCHKSPQLINFTLIGPCYFDLVHLLSCKFRFQFLLLILTSLPSPGCPRLAPHLPCCLLVCALVPASCKTGQSSAYRFSVPQLVLACFTCFLDLLLPIGF